MTCPLTHADLMRTYFPDLGILCKMCGGWFQNTYTWEYHHYHYHRLLSNWCDACTYRCSSLRDLVEHKMQIHHIEGYYCDICELTFDDRNIFANHGQEHHSTFPISEERNQRSNQIRYKCEKCIPPRANICTFGMLLDHYKRHHVPPIYPCFMCLQRFDNSYSLAIHKNMHYQRRCCVCLACLLVYSSIDYFNLEFGL